MPQKINEVKEKTKRHEGLTDDDLDLLEILSFYQNIVLSLCPYNYVDLFTTRLNQKDVHPISQIASSDKLDKLGGLLSVYSEPGIYTEEEISNYLENLSKAIQSVGYQNQPVIGFMLRSYNHTIGITYDPKMDSWSLLDINLWPPQKFNHHQTKQLARAVYNALNLYRSSSQSYIAFNTQIITTPNNPKLSQLVGTLIIQKENHIITKELSMRTGDATLAYVAANDGHIKETIALAELGTNFDIPAADGKTPAYITAQNDHADVLRVLAENGANLDLISSDGGSPTFIAAQLGCAAALEVLGEYRANLDLMNNEGVPPIYIAAQNGHANACAVLGKYGADLNVVFDEMTPMFSAAQYGHADVINVLAKYGADVNTPRADGMTPVFSAAYFGHSAAIAALATNEANLDLPYNGTTPVFIAAQEGHAEAIEMLANYGANLNTPWHEELDVTPCYIAAQNGHIDALKVLVAHDADFERPNNNGETPEQVAELNGHDHIVQFFRQLRAKTPNPHGFFNQTTAIDQQKLQSTPPLSKKKEEDEDDTVDDHDKPVDSPR